MKKLVAAVTVAALLASGAAPPVLAGISQRHHGIRHGPTYYAGGTFKHRPYYGHRYRYGYRHRYRYRHGGTYYYHDDGAVFLGVLAGAVVLGSLLSRPPPSPILPPVPRSPTGAPLGGCRRTTGSGTWYGHPAQFSGTLCYDPAGRAYVLTGSERFVGYLR
jgi:hypothetical protein